MREFAKLYYRMDATTKSSEKIEAICDYLKSVSADDAAWGIAILSGHKLRRVAPNKLLRRWVTERAGIPEWLFEETYSWVGDLAETLSAVLPLNSAVTHGSLTDWMDHLQALRSLDEPELMQRLDELIPNTAQEDRFVLMKLFTGTLRVGAAKGLLIKAVSRSYGISVDTVAHRLMGEWVPSKDFFHRLVDSETSDSDISRPFPFALASALDSTLQELGSIDEYQAEWKWDGIRAQLIRRHGLSFLWSRGEERLDGRYPEIESEIDGLPEDCVLDGELLGWKDERPLPFSSLQKRINRKSVGKKLLAEVPVCFMAFDILEYRGDDLRKDSLRDRRAKLLSLFHSESPSNLHAIRCAEVHTAASWSDLESIKNSATLNSVEGLMLKRLDSGYPTGRTRGPWWKWKVDPLTIDAVMIYAQRGHGRRAALYTDYTFALWEQGQLVPFAKAYSGLTDQEIREVDRFVRSNTVETFGPVRSVRPHLVMELAFENVQHSSRHKCGLAVRFPRIVRWRHDKTPVDANQLNDLKQLVRP
jgi:DNA ligase 1